MYIRSNIVYPHNLVFQMRYVLLFVDVDYMDTYIYIYICMRVCNTFFLNSLQQLIRFRGLVDVTHRKCVSLRVPFPTLMLIAPYVSKTWPPRARSVRVFCNKRMHGYH